MGLLVSLRLAFMRVNRALSVIAESPNKSFDPAQSFKAVCEAYWQPLTNIISVKGVCSSAVFIIACMCCLTALKLQALQLR